MIKKGIIEEVIDRFTVRARIPQIHGIKGEPGSTATEQISPAIICSIPNINIYFRVNDVVIIDFENDDLSKPIILGVLYAEGNNRSVVDICANTLTVDVRTILEKDSDIDRINDRLNDLSQTDLELITNEIKSLNERFDNIINGDNLFYGGK